MEEALRAAQRALETGEVPVGAVVICDGRVIAQGWNRNLTGNDPTAHVEELPKKRPTRKVCSETANVFAIWIWDSRFGIAYYLPEVIDLAPIHPTVLPSERAEVELESVDVYQGASA